MPPRRAKKVVKTVRVGRGTANPKIAAAAAAAAAAETDAETAASETPATASQAAEIPTLETPAAAAAAEETADETTTVGEGVKVATGSPTTEIPPKAAETPAAAEAATNETIAVGEEAPAPEIPPPATGLEAQPADAVPEAKPGSNAPAEGEAIRAADVATEARAVEPADAPQTTVETAEAAPARKTTKIVRKVIRRVPVKRIRNKTESAAIGKEDKGDGGGEEMAPQASVAGEQNSNGAEAVSMAIEEQNPTAAEGGTISVEGQNSNGAETVSNSVEKQNTVSYSDRSSAAWETKPHAEAAVSAAAASADGASAVVLPQRRVRKVKKRILVKRLVKASEVSQKEENVEEVRGPAEKFGIPGNDANSSEPCVGDKADMEVEAPFVPDGSLKMEEDVTESGKDDPVKGYFSRSVDAEQGKVEGVGTSSGSAGDQVMGISEGQKRRKTEIFIGGLDRNAKEDDIRKVFGKVGEIVEVRMMMDKKTGKNKGYAFLRYATAAQAKQAVKEFTKVEVCGKQCGAAALEGNDTIFLGNIDKMWKKDDVIKLLHEIGIDKIDTVTLMPDPKNPNCNRGFAFLDFETNRDAQTAFKKLQKKDVFGKGRNIKVAWAEPLTDPDEEEMQKVKSVFAEGIPSSWDEKKVRECFKRFGQIERVVLSRNMHSAKRKDFAFVNFTTREAALSCIESFDKDLANNGSKVNMKVSLAKPVQKNKQNKVGMKPSDKGSSKVKPKSVQRDTKVNISVKSQSSKGAHGNIGEDKMSTNHELLHVLREQAAWKQISYSRGPAIPDHSGALHGGKRPLSALGDDALYADPRGYPRARRDSAYPAAGPSYSSLSLSTAGSSLEYYQQSGAGYGTGSVYGAVGTSRTLQARPGSAPYKGGLNSRY